MRRTVCLSGLSWAENAIPGRWQHATHCQSIRPDCCDYVRLGVDADGCVPADDNSALVGESYKRSSGEIIVIDKLGVGRHPQGWDEFPVETTNALHWDGGKNFVICRQICGAQGVVL